MIQALIADNPTVARRGLKELLGESDEIAIAGEAGTAGEVLEKIRTARCDVLVLDLNLPDGRGLDLLRRLRSEHPDLPVLIVTVSPEDRSVAAALGADVSGMLAEENTPEELVGAVREIVHRERQTSARSAEPERPPLAAGPHERLSDREDQVMRLLASGKTVSQAAGQLRLSVKTVSTYRSRVLAKMSMRTNAELTYYAVRNRLVE